MSVSDDLIPVLKKLRLSGVLNTLDLRTSEAVDQNLSHAEFLFRVCSDEVQRRDSKQLDLRMRRASFESTQRIDDFDWSFNPGIPKAKIIDLAACHFIERREAAILIGPAGVGKSHIAQAIGERACRCGHSVCYVSAHKMLAQLRASRADQTYDRKMLRFTSPDLLIIDDLGPDGPRPFDPVVVRPMSEITATLGQVLVDRAAFPAFDAIVGPQQRLVPVDRDAV